MKGNRKKSYVILAIMVVLAVLPIALARWVYHHPEWLSGRSKHHGQLTAVVDMHTHRVKSAQGDYPLSHWVGKWTLLYDTAGTCCQQACLKEVHQLHQLRIALHQGIERTRVVLLQGAQCPTPKILRSDHLWLQNSEQHTRWDHALRQVKEGPRVLIMDPNMMVMMRYASTAPPRSIYEDMRTLLHVSQIG